MSDKGQKHGCVRKTRRCFFADLSPVVGSEQGGNRPVLIIQNNVGNHYSPTVIVAAITSKIQKPKMPTHVGLRAKQDGVERNSVILLEQIRTIDKQRLQARVTALSSTKMAAVDRALARFQWVWSVCPSPKHIIRINSNALNSAFFVERSPERLETGDKRPQT